MFTPQSLFDAIELNDTAYITECLKSEGFAAKLIMAENLARPIQSGLNQGINIVWILCSRKEGRALLKDPQLLEKLTPQGLSATGHHGAKAGINAVWWLCSTEDGITLLAENNTLREKLTFGSLGAIARDGEVSGINAVWLLCSTPMGINLLRSDPLLRAKVTSEHLSATANYRVKRGINVVWLLCSTADGIELLIEDPKLRGELTGNNLKVKIQRGVNKGKNAVWALCSSPRSQELLARDSVLRSKISTASLGCTANLGTDEGINAVWWLCATVKGRTLLANDTELREKLTAPILIAAPKHGVDKGKSAIWWLCATEQGRNILQHNVTLRNKLTDIMLSTGPHLGKNGAHHLIESNVWLQLIAEIPSLRLAVIDSLYYDLFAAVCSKENIRIAQSLQISYGTLTKSQLGYQLLSSDLRLCNIVNEAIKAITPTVPTPIIPVPSLQQEQAQMPEVMDSHTQQQLILEVNTQLLPMIRNIIQGLGMIELMKQQVGELNQVITNLIASRPPMPPQTVVRPMFFKAAPTTSSAKKPEDSINIANKREIAEDGAFEPIKRARNG